MKNCLKLLPHKSYNTCGLVSLILFVSFGLVVIVIASGSKTALQCNPDKTLGSDLSTRKYIETQCSLKYAKEFNHSLPLHVLLVINFGIVLVFIIIYAYLVKHRVEFFADFPSSTTVNPNNVENQSQPLMSQAESDPTVHQDSQRYIVFTVYIMHLIIGRIIPLVIFAILLLNSSNYPNSFNCPWPIRTISTLSANLTQKQTTNVSTVDCTNPVGKQNEIVAASVITVNFLYGSLAFIELAYLLWLAIKDHNICTDMEFSCVYILRKLKRIRKLMKKIRETASEDIFYLHDDFGEKGLSRRKLEEMFVNVKIQDGRESSLISRRKYENRHETYEAHLQAPQGATSLAITANLFKRTSAMKTHPRTILVVGRPGIGKSLLTTKILYQWQQQAHIFWHDKIVILIRFRTFNNRKTSLREMLHHAEGLRNASPTDFFYIYEYICLNPRNVVIIFDGLDELRTDESVTEENTVNSHNEVTHVLQVFKQLMKGELLRGVTVLTTSRPTGEQIYIRLQFDREVEILGFHEEQINNYVQRFCINDFHKGIKIWEYIKDSPELLSLCYIPVNCYIVCLTLTETIKDDSFEVTDHNLHDSNVPRTVTELYKRAIRILLYKHNLKYKDKPIPKDYIISKLPEHLQNDLNKLKEIAWNGMINDELIFQVQNDDEFLSELSDCGLFNKLEDKRYNVFCFLHLTIQEFLAAQHVVDEIENVESFMSENIKNPRWHLVIQFVAGLIGDKIKELKAERNVSGRSSKITLRKNKTFIDRICRRFQDWIPKTNRITDEDNALLVIKCVYEMQDLDVMKVIATFPCKAGDEKYKEFSLEGLKIAPMESTALFEFLSNIKNLYKLKIFLCVMEHFGFSELGKLLNRGTEITHLDLVDTRITDRGAKHVFDALKNKSCELTTLFIKGCNLKDVSAKYLSAALKNDKCKLTKLKLSFNELTDVGAEYLSDALKTDNCKLTELGISFNELTYVGTEHLSHALKSENGKLTKLDIRFNELTAVGAEYLSNALKSENCKLTELDVSDNELRYVGAEYLSDALKSENCKLTKLDMSATELTDVGIGYLSHALKSKHCKLTKLDISFNKLTYVAVEYLGDALKRENCKATELDISDNKLTDVGARYLSDALMSENSKLTKLNISYNELTDVGAGYLSDALKSENCKLAELDISGNNLTDVGVGYLRGALKSENCKLVELVIRPIHNTIN